MTSLRGRLTWGLTLACCLLWSGAAGALYLAMRAGLTAEFDRSLRAQAQTLEVLSSQENGILEFDWSPEAMASFARAERPDYFEIRLADGSTWKRSPSLAGTSLPPLASDGVPRFSNLVLPDGLAGRAAAVRFVVPQTDEPPLPAVAPPVSAALVVARHRTDLDRSLRLLALTLLSVGGAAAAATAFFVRFVVERGLRPLSGLAARAAAIDASDLTVRFPTADTPLELQPIGSRLNELLARLQSSFERERRFSADVAHELRTPIAELRLLAEVALRWPDDRAATGRALQDALDIALQLESITIGLLALARYDAGLQPLAREPVRVAAALDATWRPLAGQAREKRLSLSVDVSDQVGCLADPVLLRLILANLLGNAVQYSPRGGAVACRARLVGGRCEIDVSNGTAELCAEDLPRLFERFWRKDPARADARSGLGLAVAKALADAMGITIRAELPQPGTLTMTLSAQPAELPASPDRDATSAAPAPRPATGAAALALALALGGAPAATAAAGPERLVVEAGRPLRVALDGRVRVKRAGQRLTATVVEPVYAYDRIVVAVGARLVGEIASLDPVPARARLKGILVRGDFSPARRVGLRFDRLVLSDGREIAIETRVGPGTSDVVLQAAEPARKGLAARAAERARNELDQGVVSLKRPGKWRRLKQAVLASLPFHAQYIREGTVYDAELLAPLDFGAAAVTERAPAGTPPPPDAVLSARLLTGLDSAKTPRGTPIRAVLTRPVLSPDGRLVLPAGALLSGEVTFTRPAGHLRQNGQLRFLFEQVRAEEQAAEALQASLQSAQVGRDARLAIDDEGGATATTPKTRFLAPALSLGVVGLSLRREAVYDPGEAGFETGLTEASGNGTAAGGFSGLALVGVGVSALSRPAGVTLGIVGFARSLYVSLIGKGRDVTLPAGTRLQLQVAPPPAN